MKVRTRLSLLSLETRENPSLMVAPPVTCGTAAVPPAASCMTTTSGATTAGTGQITSTGTVTVTTTPAPAPTTGILATGNNLSGQPILESSLLVTN